MPEPANLCALADRARTGDVLAGWPYLITTRHALNTVPRHVRTALADRRGDAADAGDPVIASDELRAFADAAVSPARARVPFAARPTSTTTRENRN